VTQWPYFWCFIQHNPLNGLGGLGTREGKLGSKYSGEGATSILRTGWVSLGSPLMDVGWLKKVCQFRSEDLSGYREGRGKTPDAFGGKRDGVWIEERLINSSWESPRRRGVGSTFLDEVAKKLLPLGLDLVPDHTCTKIIGPGGSEIPSLMDCKK